MYFSQIILDPLDKVILECSLDDLVEEVRDKELMDVRLQELYCKRLQCYIKNFVKNSKW